MNETESSLHKVINVSISDVKFSNDGSLLRTTLGSCVSVVLYSLSRKPVCSMSHYLLPEPVHSTDVSRMPFRFGSILIPHQIAKMQENGISLSDLRAKITGGAAMFPVKQNSVLGDIGLDNVRIAEKILAQNGIAVVSTSTGGTYGRAIEYDPETFRLRVVVFGSEPFFI